MTIRSEIESRLAAFAKTKNIPVAYENVSFTKPTDGPYLEVFLLDTAARSRNLSADKRVTGMFQVNCYAPIGKGMAAIEALVDGVINTYPVLPKEGTVSIEAPLSASQGMPVDGFMCVPVTGRYRVEV